MNIVDFDCRVRSKIRDTNTTGFGSGVEQGVENPTGLGNGVRIKEAITITDLLRVSGSKHTYISKIYSRSLIVIMAESLATHVSHMALMANSFSMIKHTLNQ